MNQSDRRRGGSGVHTQRSGQAHASTPAGGASSANSNMPALPPRAAVSGGNSSGSDELHDGAAVEQADSDAGLNGSLRNSIDHARSSSRDTQRRSDPVGAALMMRDKDDRIAYLENEMSIMEREFQTELDKLSQIESETASFWQGKHSALHQQFLRTDTELRLIRNEADAHEAEREDLRHVLEALRRELRDKDDEIRKLRTQVRGLKDFVSTSTRTDDQMSDELFGDGMMKLGSGLQNWVIFNFRRAKIDLSKVSEETLEELNELVPMYEEMVHLSKVHFFQSLVSQILVESVFDEYYVGLTDEQTIQFQDMEELVSTLCSSTEEPVNQWRSSTLALIRREAHHLHDSTDDVVEVVAQRITSLLSSITASSSSSPPSSTPSTNQSEALRALVKNSIDLARLLVVQKARLRIYMPAILPDEQVPFEPDTMEDVGGEDEDALSGRYIACCVFPGVVKFGDENGENAQYRNVIARAKVLCRPEEE